MRKSTSIPIGDPDDLSKLSYILWEIVLQSQRLDHVRRLYKLQKNKTAKRKSEEIMKLLKKISKMEIDVIRNLKPDYFRGSNNAYRATV